MGNGNMRVPYSVRDRPRQSIGTSGRNGGALAPSRGWSSAFLGEPTKNGMRGSRKNLASPPEESKFSHDDPNAFLARGTQRISQGHGHPRQGGSPTRSGMSGQFATNLNLVSSGHHSRSSP